jgi:steroid 5-alpha reductase family enzyme
VRTLLTTEIAVIAVYMTIWFLIALRLKRNDVADTAWGGGFVVAAFTALVVAGTVTTRAAIVTFLVVIWGLRLAIHIGLRGHGRGEDPRYQAWREAWGRYVVVRAFLQIFMLQGLLMLIISLPVIRINSAPPGALTILDGLGVALWLTGFLFEATGDWQLKQFIRNPANQGKIIDRGLWRYSRHPNYFGEVTQWWGVYLIALSVPWGWMTIPGPITITVLILFVSGIPMLERRYEGNAEFEAYKRRTSAFFPLPPKR